MKFAFQQDTFVHIAEGGMNTRQWKNKWRGSEPISKIKSTGLDDSVSMEAKDEGVMHTSYATPQSFLPQPSSWMLMSRSKGAAPSVVHRPASSVSPGNLFKMQVPGPTSLCWIRISGGRSPPKWLFCTLQFEKHWRLRFHSRFQMRGDWIPESPFGGEPLRRVSWTGSPALDFMQGENKYSPG